MKYKGIELKPINKVQAFEEPREMVVWQHSKDKISDNTGLIVAIINLNGVVRALVNDGTYWNYCAEIPKPKTRRMNKDEIEFYLWKKNKTEFVQISFGNGAFRSGGFGNFGYDDLSYYRFRTIDENGKVTEFELPEIEVNNDI